MSEVLVVNLFLWVRVFLVGGIFLLLPRISRKGLLFGVYVGEEFAGGRAYRALVKSWDRGCWFFMAAALLVGLVFSAAGHAVAGNLTGTAVLLLGVGGLYLRTNSRARWLAPPDVPPQAWRATAALEMGTRGGETIAKVSLVICLVAALATVIYGLANYQSLPARLPTLWNMIGGGESFTDKSILMVMYVPSWNLVLGPLFALLALMTATAKRSLRVGPGGRSGEAQDAFRATNANVFSGFALFYCALLTYSSVQVVRIGLSQTDSLGAGILWLLGATLVFMFGSLYVILFRYGQGGSRVEQSSAGGALTGGLADNTHWFLGMFYVNRDDPSIMVENRFGLGYTMNYGNRTAQAFTFGFLFLISLLVAVGVFLL